MGSCKKTLPMAMPSLPIIPSKVAAWLCWAVISAPCASVNSPNSVISAMTMATISNP